ncbi:hypothetical protein X734_26600 [Mesorhizobium sp. L2C084A000]|nr:hypothetical protein X734_26600 [Mesorhizobium sp. L2C084A000]
MVGPEEPFDPVIDRYQVKMERMTRRMAVATDVEPVRPQPRRQCLLSFRKQWAQFGQSRLRQFQEVVGRQLGTKHQVPGQSRVSPVAQEPEIRRGNLKRFGTLQILFSDAGSSIVSE